MAQINNDIVEAMAEVGMNPHRVPVFGFIELRGKNRPKYRLFRTRGEAQGEYDRTQQAMEEARTRIGLQEPDTSELPYEERMRAWLTYRRKFNHTWPKELPVRLSEVRAERPFSNQITFSPRHFRLLCRLLLNCSGQPDALPIPGLPLPTINLGEVNWLAACTRFGNLHFARIVVRTLCGMGRGLSFGEAVVRAYRKEAGPKQGLHQFVKAMVRDLVYLATQGGGHLHNAFGAKVGEGVRKGLGTFLCADLGVTPEMLGHHQWGNGTVKVLEPVSQRLIREAQKAGGARRAPRRAPRRGARNG